MTVVADALPRRAAPDRAGNKVLTHWQDRSALAWSTTRWEWDWYELPFALGVAYEDLEAVLGEHAVLRTWDLGPLARRLTGLLSRLVVIAVRQGYVAAAPVTRSRRLCTSTEPDCFIQAQARVRLLALATSDLLDLLLEDPP
ncbi:hypothetical protein CU044_2575 [Streptomyces sp. L-9-10]|uniref:DUF6415 family natural product biosynthesis protein n=1 Tax=Streptomyces sp. L-9-10 TaxID=1478131 RepID=UPI00101C412F|nr:DUF6415 family natural product biosynthesis protein [Streptomyces sp. L-9-10]RYJ28814.1 hypothetical protein CU044_2575 [Streptomyces sp. L-9-10]